MFCCFRSQLKNKLWTTILKLKIYYLISITWHMHSPQRYISKNDNKTSAECRRNKKIFHKTMMTPTHGPNLLLSSNCYFAHKAALIAFNFEIKNSFSSSFFCRRRQAGETQKEWHTRKVKVNLNFMNFSTEIFLGQRMHNSG